MASIPIYKLTSPRYITDRAEAQANPIKQTVGLWMPGIRCDHCGNTWSGSRRLYFPITDPQVRRRLKATPIDINEWLVLAKSVQVALPVGEAFKIIPGDEFGTPIFEVRSAKFSDIMHPFPGTLVVSERVLTALESAKTSGFQPVRAETIWAKRIKAVFGLPPKLYILRVFGMAWRLGSEIEQGCDLCGRPVYQSTGNAIDLDRWDKSDFFHVDENPNIVYVTKRVCETLTRFQFTNYECVSF